MISRLHAIVLALLLASLAGAAAAAPCAVVVDISGSMKGFVLSPNARLQAIVDRLDRACPSAFAFGSGFQERSGPLTAKAFHGDTWLGDALERWMSLSPSGVAVFVTDNVADTSGEADNQEKFYRLLHNPRSRFSQVTVYLARLPFEGPVFAVGQSQGRLYAHPRALTFYVLARAGADAAGARGAVEAALAGAGMAPQGPTPTASDYLRVQLAPLDLSSERPAELRLKHANHARLMSDGSAVVLDPASVKSETRFTVQITPELKKDWSIRAARLRAQIEFPATDAFGPRMTIPCSASPANIDLTSAAPVEVSCRIPPMERTLDPARRKAVERRGKVVRSGQLKLLVEVDRASMALAGPLKGWSYDGPPDRLGDPDPAVQGSIYQLQSLLTRMIPNRSLSTTGAAVPVLQVGWSVDAGALGGMLAIIVVLLVLAGGGYLLMQGKEYEFAGDTSASRLVRRLRGGQAQVLDPGGGQSRVSVRPILVGFLVGSTGGPVSPRFLPREGGDFAMQSGSPRFSVRPVRSHASTGRRSDLRRGDHRGGRTR